MKITGTILGASELVQKLTGMSRDFREQALGTAVGAGAMLIENSAKEKVPKLTGNLARSIHTNVTTTTNQAAAEIGTDAEYAAQVEFGGTIYPKNGKYLVFTINGKKIFAKKVTQRARPYLRPAFDEKKDAALKEVGEAFKDILSNYAK